MRTLILAIDLVLEIYIFVLLAVAILAWLIGFRVVPSGGRGITPAHAFLRRVTDPVLRPIRFALPRSTIDVSPVIMIIVIMAVRYALAIYALPNVR